jgi:hypothetical protein
MAGSLQIVAEHPRSFSPAKTTFDSWRYAPVLARKPLQGLNLDHRGCLRFRNAFPAVGRLLAVIPERGRKARKMCQIRALEKPK